MGVSLSGAPRGRVIEGGAGPESQVLVSEGKVAGGFDLVGKEKNFNNRYLANKEGSREGKKSLTWGPLFVLQLGKLKGQSAEQ